MTPDFFFYFIIFLSGSAVGSFLNSIIYRLQTGESFLFQRSYCPNCKKILSWQDLIPLLSFLFLKGKCRYCQGKISWQYPLVEIATAVLFLLILNSQFSGTPLGGLSGGLISDQFPILNFQFLNFIYLLIVFCFLIIIFVYDLKHYIIPDKIIYPAIIVALVYNIFSFFIFHLSFKTFINPLLSAILASAFFLAIVLISRGKWMGWGDPKLAFFMGLLLGFPNILVALFLAFLIGAIIGVGLIIFKKKALKSEIPFGPFLVTGTFIALFWGNNLINWYLHLFW